LVFSTQTKLGSVSPLWYVERTRIGKPDYQYMNCSVLYVRR